MQIRTPSRNAWSTSLLAVSCLALLAAASGCVHRHHHHGHGPVVVKDHSRHGPPPHAPAHGYRKKHPHDRVELVFDTAIGVYVVVGHTGVYWDGRRYLRWEKGVWRTSVRIGGVWAVVERQHVPTVLVVKHDKKHKKAKKGRRGRGHGPPARYGD